VPEDWRHAKVRVVLSREPAEELPELDMSKIKTPLDAFKELRKLGGLSHIIPDPVAWQREIREDRPLPGRE
jgi:hypothetical protein